MREPAEPSPTPAEAPRVTLSGALLIPLLGLGMLHGLMSAFDAFYI